MRKLKNHIFLVTLIATGLLIALAITFSAIYGFHLITIEKETSKSITTVIMEVSGSFIGFLVIYLSIYFENLKKNYGKQALRIFRNDQLVLSLSALFTIIVLIALTNFLLSDGYPFWSEILFNLSCTYFFIAASLLIPLGNAVLNKSGSTEPFNNLVNTLELQDFSNIPTRKMASSLQVALVSSYRSNKFSDICDLLFYNINEGNSKNSVHIIIIFFDRIKILLQRNDENHRKRIIIAYITALWSAFDLAIAKNDSQTVRLIFASLNSLSDLITQEDENYIIEKIEETLSHFGNTVIGLENELLIDEWKWLYFHVGKNFLNNLMPNEADIWAVDATGFIDVLNTDTAEKKDNIFSAIESLIAYKFANTVERAFLCRNYYIINDCVRMIGTFTSEIIYNTKMGSHQKHRIGSMIASQSEEAIKRYIDGKFPIEKNFLYLYLGSSTIINALEQNTDFSDAVFNTAINIISYAIDQDRVTKFDIDRLSGLCRLIIANAKKINKTVYYVEEILKVQKKMKSRCVAHLRINRSSNVFMRETIKNLQQATVSYLTIMQRKSNSDPILVALISRYL